MDVKNHYFESAERYRCPVCMGNMREVDRVQEDGFFFVWYECSRTTCDEQLLEKKPLRAMAV